MSLKHPAVFIYIIAVRSPESGNRLGVALVESFDEGLGSFGDLPCPGIAFRSPQSLHAAQGNAGESQQERMWNHLHFVSSFLRFIRGFKHCIG